MITAEIFGVTETVEKFSAVPAKARAAAKSALGTWGAELAAYIRNSKLSGQVLNRRSGNLAASVDAYHDQTATTVTGGAAGGGGLRYAKIHEFGGVIPAHQVIARNARALAFMVGGQLRFAKSVQIPDVRMPERSYMRSAFAERTPDGIEQLRAAVYEAMAL